MQKTVRDTFYADVIHGSVICFARYGHHNYRNLSDLKVKADLKQKLS